MTTKLQAVGIVAVLTPIAGAILFMATSITLFADAFVLSRIWQWYAMPFGAPAIAWSTWCAALLCKNVIWRSEASQVGSSDKTDGEHQIAKFVGLALTPWFALLVAWCLK